VVDKPPSLEDIVIDLVERVSRLEERKAGSRGDTFWMLDVLRGRDQDASGHVVFAGVVHTPTGRQFEWQEERTVVELVDDEWAKAAASLAALGHPVRLALLRALYEGVHTVRELGSLPDVGTTGQIYHHMRDLQAAGWVRQERRNSYTIPPDRIVPLLAILSAATSSP